MVLLICFTLFIIYCAGSCGSWIFCCCCKNSLFHRTYRTFFLYLSGVRFSLLLRDESQSDVDWGIIHLKNQSYSKKKEYGFAAPQHFKIMLHILTVFLGLLLEAALWTLIYWYNSRLFLWFQFGIILIQYVGNIWHIFCLLFPGDSV